MRRIVAGMVLIVLILVIAPAGAQNGSVWLTPESPEPFESAREVVITVSLWRAGRVAYRTFDGACTVTYSPGGTPPDATCGGEKARAPADYTATSGELVFTEVEGSKTITIPIVDDDLAEGDEYFTLAAWEEVNADPWIDRGDSVAVHIIDDDGVNEGYAVATIATTAPESNSSSTAPVVTVPRTRSPIGDRPVPGLPVELASPNLQPGPGFELTSDRSPQPAPAREVGGGGPASALAGGLGAVALSVGALAVVRRRGRWSPTHA